MDVHGRCSAATATKGGAAPGGRLASLYGYIQECFLSDMTRWYTGARAGCGLRRSHSALVQTNV
jgi:hypothetical protein